MGELSKLLLGDHRGMGLGELRAGDLVWFHHAGAYGWSISHHDFLSHPHPRRLFLGALPPALFTLLNPGDHVVSSTARKGVPIVSAERWLRFIQARDAMQLAPPRR